MVSPRRYSTALLRPVLPPLLRQKVLEVRQQERPKLSLLVVEMLQIISGQQPREEILSQVLCFRRVVSITLNVSVEWTPICAAQFLQRRGYLE